MRSDQFTAHVHPTGVAEVVLDRPPVNALNAAGWHALAATVEELGQRDDVRVIVVRAEGRGFCAGVDIKELNAASTQATTPPSRPSISTRSR